MLEKHHIIFKSQLGLDFTLNYKYLTAEEHRGNNSPHKCRLTDLKYKKQLEYDLRDILVDEHYTLDQLIKLLGLKNKQANKAFRHLRKTDKGMEKEQIIFKLMGDRFYL